ncbi:SRPBCC family protein [Nocardiopsis ansamitocini]|uniref:Cyclase n=1 Tax=Nocardiopsis ansamitocini TaxID=1670832 RepID=A0A9W6P6Y0_9ACTN|nr:SRPBCC family protein [Nocardiopsis ansamitocini]GLU48192.1 cyclase [Nocardiopsis ansamitocini]
MSEVIEAVEVDVPVRQVYDQWTRFESFPEFMGGVERITQQDDTHSLWEVSVGGQHREFEAVVTEQVPDERIAWKSVDGVSHAGVVTFHRIGPQRTRVTLQLHTAPEGVVEQLGDKLGVVKARVKSDMKHFREFIESHGGPAQGGWRGEVAPGHGEVRPDGGGDAIRPSAAPKPGPGTFGAPGGPDAPGAGGRGPAV